MSIALRMQRPEVRKFGTVTTTTIQRKYKMNARLTLGFATALMLNGCAVQPSIPTNTVAPVAPAERSYLSCSQEERAQENFAGVSILVLDKCFAGDNDMCLNGMNYIKRAEAMFHPDAEKMKRCIQDGFYQGRPVAAAGMAQLMEELMDKLTKYQELLKKALKTGRFGK